MWTTTFLSAPPCPPGPGSNAPACALAPFCLLSLCCLRVTCPILINKRAAFPLRQRVCRVWEKVLTLRYNCTNLTTHGPESRLEYPRDPRAGQRAGCGEQCGEQCVRSSVWGGLGELRSWGSCWGSCTGEAAERGSCVAGASWSQAWSVEDAARCGGAGAHLATPEKPMALGRAENSSRRQRRTGCMRAKARGRKAIMDTAQVLM